MTDISITFGGLTVAEAARLIQAHGTVDDPKAQISEDYAAVTPLNSPQMSDFMSGVSELSSSLLKLLAEHETGEPSWSELMAAAGYPKWQQLRSFFGGLTKRVRTVTGDPKANFYGIKFGGDYWKNDETNGDWEDNPIFLHPVTLASLRKYFGLN